MHSVVAESGRQGQTSGFSQEKTEAVLVRSGCAGLALQIPSEGFGPTLVRSTRLARGASSLATGGAGPEDLGRAPPVSPGGVKS